MKYHWIIWIIPMRLWKSTWSGAMLLLARSWVQSCRRPLRRRWWRHRRRYSSCAWWSGWPTDLCPQQRWLDELRHHAAARHLQAYHDRDHLQGRSGSVASCTEDAELLKTSSRLVHAWTEKCQMKWVSTTAMVSWCSPWCKERSQGRIQASWHRQGFKISLKMLRKMRPCTPSESVTSRM